MRKRLPTSAPSILSLATAALSVLLASGCGYTSLEDDWSGEVDCGSDGSLDLDMEIEENGTAYYDAVGLLQKLTLDGAETTIELVLEIEQTKANGKQVLEIHDPVCQAVRANGSTTIMDCSDFDELGWDGADTISASISNFLSLDLDCDLTLER